LRTPPVTVAIDPVPLRPSIELPKRRAQRGPARRAEVITPFPAKRNWQLMRRFPACQAEAVR
jgi:hypothetical protein